MRKRLSDQERLVVATVWAGRADDERATAEMFRLVADGLATVGDAELATQARAAVDAELRHAERCWQLACSYAERTLPQPRAGEPTLPAYDGASEELRHTLRICAQCCLAATTAAVLLERCLRDARELPVRDLLRDLIGEELAHARIGWAHLETLSPEKRQSLAAWLPQLLARNERILRRDVIVAPTGAALASHGVPTRDTIEEVVEAVFAEWLVPAFRHVGITLGR